MKEILYVICLNRKANFNPFFKYLCEIIKLYRQVFYSD